MFGVKTRLKRLLESAGMRLDYRRASAAARRRRPSGAPTVVFSPNPAPRNENVAMYEYLVLSMIAQAGCPVLYLAKADFDFYRRLGRLGRLLVWTENMTFAEKLPADTSGMIFAFDHEHPDEGALARSWKKIVYVNTQRPGSWVAGGRSVRLPFPMSGPVYRTGQHLRLDRWRRNLRRVRVFFAGNAASGYYDNAAVKRYGQMTRREGIAAVVESGLPVRHRPGRRELEGLLYGSRDVREIVIADFEKFRIPPASWMDHLSRAGFFLCFSGTDYPFSLHSVEALAAGTVPILSYADWFGPPLEHGKNAIVYSGAADLVRKLKDVLAMSDAETARLSENAARYYDEHLAPSNFRTILESETPEGETWTMFPRLVRETPEEETRDFRRLADRFSRLQRSAAHA